MPAELPNEILLHVSKLLGEDSTLYLKSFSLLNRQWHSEVAPVLLSTISVSSLSKLIELCDHIFTFGGVTGGKLQSTIELSTKTIVINGEVLGEGRTDCYAGLEDLGDIQHEDESNATGISLSSEQILSKLHSLPRLVSLEGLEWYGRFAGDYYLVRYLQRTYLIRHLTYGIEEWGSNKSIAYHEHAFFFRGLKTLTIMSECQPRANMLFHILEMMRSNTGLEKILFDFKFTSSWVSSLSLMMFMSEGSQPGGPIFVWPNLRHLILRSFNGPHWRDPTNSSRIAMFLAAHPNLETLVLSEAYGPDDEGNERGDASSFSLASYQGSLPRLKTLLGSPELVAGVLESPSACLSVLSIISDLQERSETDAAKANNWGRIIAALKKVPTNQVRRVTLKGPELGRAVYATLARVVPNVQFFEVIGLLRDNNIRDEVFNPVADITTELNGLTKLDTIGADIASNYTKKTYGSAKDSLLELAKQVPRMKAVHCGGGALLNLVRDSDGNPVHFERCYLDNDEHDWMPAQLDWRYRPMSRRGCKDMRELESVHGLLRLTKE